MRTETSITLDKAALAACLGDVAQLPGQFQHAQTLLSQLRSGVSAARFSLF